MALVTLLAPVLAPEFVLGQEASGPFQVVQLERRYEAAVSSCEAAVLARRADQDSYERALRQVEAAGRGGSDEALEAAQYQFLEISAVIDQRQRRVVEQCGRAEEARREYLGGLDDRRRALEAELVERVSPMRAGQIDALLTDIDNRYQELERQQGGIEIQLVMRPLIQIAGTDTPEAVEQKAAFLRRLITMADSLIVDFEEDLERLESRIQRQQGRENFESGLGRFDQLRTPVSSGGGGDDSRARAGSDSTAVGVGPLESRLRAIRDAKLQIEHYRDEMKARVREFETYLERIT